MLTLIKVGQADLLSPTDNLPKRKSATEPGTGGGRVKTPGEARGESPTETIVPDGRLVIQTYANLTQLTHENPGS